MKKLLTLLAFLAVTGTASADGVITFGNADPGRDFITDAFLVSGVNNLESDLADGSHVLINFNSEGNPNGKFWTADAAGEWTNSAAVEAMNNDLSTEFVNADFAAGCDLKLTAPGPGDAHSNLFLSFNANEGDEVTIYVSVYGQNGPLDNVTVNGLDETEIAYAVGNGDGFVADPTFAQEVRALTLVKITGKLTADKQVQITSTSMAGDNSAKNGFQIAGYKVGTAAVAIESLALVGTFPGMTWEPTEGIAMNQDIDNPAIWSVTMEGVEIAAGTYEYKVTANGTWGDFEIPASGNQDFTFGTEGYPAGIYNLTFTADTENNELTLVPELQQPEEPVGAGVITFGNADPGKDFITDPFMVNGVTNLETDLTDGTHMLFNFDSEGNPNGKFWAGAVTGDWNNSAAVEAMNMALGTAFENADFAAGSSLQMPNPGPGDSHCNLILTFNNAPKNTLDLYATVGGVNGPLDNVTVSGLDNVIISYAVGDGDGFVSTPTFSSEIRGVTLVRIQGYLGEDKTVTVSSTSMAGDNSAKNGFQIAAYTFTDETLPFVINSMAVVGTFPGMTWDPTASIAMIQDSENPAVWTASLENIEVEAQTYEYKVTANGKWGVYELPESGNYDFTFGNDDYPAGTYNLTFTADTENHTLTLVVEASEAPIEEDVFTVVGNAPFFGEAWDITDEGNDMEKGEDGIYTKTFENVVFESEYTIEYKVVKNHSWTENWGFTFNSEANADYYVNRAGTYTITFKFVPDGTLADNDCSVTCIVNGVGDTGINAVDSLNSDGVVYNLQGMRVTNVQKGLYIVNGRKVVIK